MVEVSPGLYMAIKISFKVYWHYEKSKDLVDKLGLARELAREKWSIEWVQARNPRLEFTLWNQGKRAIFVRADEGNLYTLIMPHNHILYGKVYSFLKSHKLAVHAELVDFEELDLSRDELKLLMKY